MKHFIDLTDVFILMKAGPLVNTFLIHVWKTKGLEQLDIVLNQLDTVTQQNAANAEHLSQSMLKFKFR